MISCEKICEIMGRDAMNKKMMLVGFLGLLSFMFGIYISQWTILGVVMGIGGGYAMGFGAFKLFN